jgi:hypothetical protein
LLISHDRLNHIHVGKLRVNKFKFARRLQKKNAHAGRRERSTEEKNCASSFSHCADNRSSLFIAPQLLRNLGVAHHWPPKRFPILKLLAPIKLRRFCLLSVTARTSAFLFGNGKYDGGGMPLEFFHFQLTHLRVGFRSLDRAIGAQLSVILSFQSFQRLTTRDYRDYESRVIRGYVGAAEQLFVCSLYFSLISLILLVVLMRIKTFCSNNVLTDS